LQSLFYFLGKLRKAISCLKKILQENIMTLIKDLQGILGKDAVADDEGTVKRYSMDQSFVQPRRPDAVAFAKSVEDVQEVVKYGNRTSTPITPYSSGLNMHGATVPAYGGIVLDMSGMDRIIEINEKDMFVIIEPGVTYEKLQDALEKTSFRIMVPFGVPPGRSVLTSYLERDVMMAAASFEYGNFLIHDMELILPDGELLRTGCWNLGGRPGGLYGPGLNMLYRLWTGAQGTLGVFTKMIISAQHLSSARRFFFIPFGSAEEIPGALKPIQRKEIGWECFGLNRFNLASILNDEWKVPDEFPSPVQSSATFEQLKNSLPPWTAVIGVTGFPHLPEEWVEIQEEALRKLCHQIGLSVDTTLPGFPGIEEVFLRESLRPWGVLKKFNYKGSVHDLSFKSPLKKMPGLEATVVEMAQKSGYPSEDIGGYFVVLERGRGVHCEFDFHCKPDGSDERESVKELWHSAGKALLDKGALFDRPYGDWADMVYSRAPQYLSKIKQLKAEMDPKGILNPGKLWHRA
jgi:hypothetical protein